MPPSYRLVNFQVRPAKVVERKMIVEVCARMNAFSNLLSFRYIGLGSPFFNDFVSLHRRYGLTNLICVEREVHDVDRFLFNKPFDCIEMRWGESSDVLPVLQWTGIPTIVWLDYDDPINDGILSDIGTIFAQLEPGSLVLFTIQAEGNTFKSEDRSAFDGLLNEIGEFIPVDASPRDLRGKAFQKLLRRILDNEFNRVLDRRNATVPFQNRVMYRQLFNVLYSDGVKMTTVGGVVYRADQGQRLADCEFDDFEFVRRDDIPLEIKVPILTHRERWRLDRDLPSGSPTIDFLASGDVSAYQSLYRYYPNFVEFDV